MTELYVRGRVWWARVANPAGGRQMRVSTGCTDQLAAHLVAVQAERAAVIAHIVRQDANGHLRRLVKTMLDEVDGGTVYVVSATATGLVKIGYTKHIKNRIAVLRNSSPHAISLVHSFRGKRSDERALHARFSTLRVRGEWFRNEGELASWIAEVQPGYNGRKVLKSRPRS